MSDSTAAPARQALTCPVEKEPESFHDFRDCGDPMVKRDLGSWSDWPNRQDREYMPGRR